VPASLVLEGHSPSVLCCAASPGTGDPQVVLMSTFRLSELTAKSLRQLQVSTRAQRKPLCTMYRISAFYLPELLV